MTADLLIVGAGGFAREAASTVETLGAAWRLLGFLDDDPALHGTIRSGVPILGGTSLLSEILATTPLAPQCG